MSLPYKYQKERIEIGKKYLRHYKYHTLVAMIAFIGTVMGIFGYYPKVGLISVLILLITVVLNGYTRTTELNEESVLIDKYLHPQTK